MPEEQEIEYSSEWPFGDSSVEPYDIAREEELLLNEDDDTNKNKK